MLKTQTKTSPTQRCSVFDYFPIYYLLIMAIHYSAFQKYTITYIFAKIQTNLDTYLLLIFQKLVEKYLKKYLKNTKNISNITKYDNKMSKIQTQTVFDCLHIYYLLIIAIPDSALRIIQQLFQNITKYVF